MLYFDCSISLLLGFSLSALLCRVAFFALFCFACFLLAWVYLTGRGQSIQGLVWRGNRTHSHAHDLEQFWYQNRAYRWFLLEVEHELLITAPLNLILKFPPPHNLITILTPYRHWRYNTTQTNVYIHSKLLDFENCDNNCIVSYSPPPFFFTIKFYTVVGPAA